MHKLRRVFGQVNAEDFFSDSLWHKQGLMVNVLGKEVDLVSYLPMAAGPLARRGLGLLWLPFLMGVDVAGLFLSIGGLCLGL